MWAERAQRKRQLQRPMGCLGPRSIYIIFRNEILCSDVAVWDSSDWLRQPQTATSSSSPHLVLPACGSHTHPVAQPRNWPALSSSLCTPVSYEVPLLPLMLCWDCDHLPRPHCHHLSPGPLPPQVPTGLPWFFLWFGRWCSKSWGQPQQKSWSLPWPREEPRGLGTDQYWIQRWPRGD